MVLPLGIEMRFTIELDYEPRRETGEISDIWSDRDLTAKLGGDAAITQAAPRIRSASVISRAQAKREFASWWSLERTWHPRMIPPAHGVTQVPRGLASLVRPPSSDPR